MKQEEFIIVSPSGELPEVQLAFVKGGDKAMSRITGTTSELLAGFSCLVKTLADKIDRDKLTLAFMMGIAPKSILDKMISPEYHDDDPVE